MITEVTNEGVSCASEAQRSGGRLMEPRIQRILKQLRAVLVDLYGDRLTHLVLFGSQARADAGPGSDIDVLVVLEGTVSPGAEIARTGPVTAALSLQYDVVISCCFVSLARYAVEQSPLLLNVHREGMPV